MKLWIQSKDYPKRDMKEDRKNEFAKSFGCNAA